MLDALEGGVEVQLADAAAVAQIVGGAGDILDADGVEPVVDEHAARGRDGEHEVVDGRVADAEERMRAHGPRGRLRREVDGAVRHGDPVVLQLVAHPGVHEPGPAGLRRDERAEHDGGRRLLADLVVGVAQQPVDRVAARGLGDGQPVLAAVLAEDGVAHAVGPRGEDDAGGHPRGEALGERLGEFGAVDAQRAQHGGDRADLGADAVGL